MNCQHKQNPQVHLCRCTEYNPGTISRAVQNIFSSLGGIEKFVSPGDSVMLKPNFIAPKSRRKAVQTDPQLILEVARLLKDCRARPFVADSPAWSNAFICAEKLHLVEPLKKLGVPLRQLDKPRKCTLSSGTVVYIGSAALEADKIINLPKFKTHQQLVATFAVKNMFGCLSGKAKALWHFRKGKSVDQFCEMLIEIYHLLNPVITIIDGVIAMDGRGPINGKTYPLGWLIAGLDPIACETVCACLINKSPEDFPIIRTAKRIGFGTFDSDLIHISGDSYTGLVTTDFELPEIIPLRFSLLRVCKSVARQIIMLAKSSLPNRNNEDAA
ncbi:MAG: DUF362 domain-containing protein [Planctomycetota bacterium]